MWKYVVVHMRTIGQHEIAAIKNLRKQTKSDIFSFSLFTRKNPYKNKEAYNIYIRQIQYFTLLCDCISTVIFSGRKHIYPSHKVNNRLRRRKNNVNEEIRGNGINFIYQLYEIFNQGRRTNSFFHVASYAVGSIFLLSSLLLTRNIVIYYRRREHHRYGDVSTVSGHT